MKQLLAFLLFASASTAFAADKATAPRPSLIETTPLVKGVVNPLQTYVGTLYYDKQSKLASEEEGAVVELAVTEGQSVKRGDLIVALDSKVLRTNIAAQVSSYKALKAELALQEKNLERSEVLYKRKAISETAYDTVRYGTAQLRARTEASKQTLEGLKTQLEKRSIRAPFDAVVASRNVDVGEWVGKGTTVATLVATETIEARVNIPATLMGILRSTQRFSATIEGKELEVTLKDLVPVADAVTRTFPVEFNLPGTMDLIEGMRIDIQIPTLKRVESPMVPRDAVIKRFGQNVVFAAVKGKAVMIPVQVIGYSTDKAAIAGQGLVEGMAIVVKGNERIFPNMPVMEKETK